MDREKMRKLLEFASDEVSLNAAFDRAIDGIKSGKITADDFPIAAGPLRQSVSDELNAAKVEALRKVFAQVAAALSNHPSALETLADYAEDADTGRIGIERLRGFLQGLSAAQALPYEDYCEVDAVLVSAFHL
jgi:hypothetical protein